MRRSQVLRRALVALLVLVVFMVILRHSKHQSEAQLWTKLPAKNDQESKLQEVTNPVAEASKTQGLKAQDNINTAVRGRDLIRNDQKRPTDLQHKLHQDPEVHDKLGAADTENRNKNSDQNSNFNAEDLFNKIVNSHDSPPVVIFSKSYCGFSMRAKKLLLEAHDITPAPKVVELDQIDHGTEIQTYLFHKTGRSTVPNVMVNGISRGGASDMVELGSDLKSKFTEWGQGKLSIVAKEAEIQESKN